MKKILLFFILIFIAFFISCSAEDSFINRIKGKTITLLSENYTAVGTFSDDGKDFTVVGVIATFIDLSTSDTDTTTAESSITFALKSQRQWDSAYYLYEEDEDYLGITITIDGSAITVFTQNGNIYTGDF